MNVNRFPTDEAQTPDERPERLAAFLKTESELARLRDARERIDREIEDNERQLHRLRAQVADGIHLYTASDYKDMREREAAERDALDASLTPKAAF